jgi:2-polyprenyl-3-methyl-5-hydroxy-6-metoxy-1,4-benzoquinol methylase
MNILKSIGINLESKCVICDSDTKLLKIGNTEILYCCKCDLNYTANIPSRNELNDFYTENYNLANNESLIGERRRIFRLPEQIRLIAEISKYIHAPANLIDIGCDKGYFLDEARRYGYHTYGVELSKSGRDYATKIGLNVYPALDDINDFFDFAVMWHSLEHFPAPLEFLENLKLKIKPGAYIFIRVPDYGSFWSKILKDKWVWFQPKNHYFHYSKKSLVLILEKAGFETVIIRSQKANDSLNRQAFVLSKNIFSKYLGIPFSIKISLSRLYQRITGIEIFCIARLKEK